MNNVLYFGDRMKKGYKKQANYKDSFEDLYLRHDYLKKVRKDIKVDMDKYENICKGTAKIMYYKHRITFNKISFYYEDILNITRVYSYSFLNVYGIRTNPDKLEKIRQEFFDKKGTMPPEEEIDRRERNNLISFLKQRLNACAIFCERKSRNIIVGNGDKLYFAYTANSTPASESLILEDHKLFGYRVVSEKEIKEISKDTENEELLDKNGYKIFMIKSYVPMPLPFFTKVNADDEHEEAERNHLSLEDSIEDKIIEMEDDIELTSIKNKFEKLTKPQKRNKLITFIKDNKDNPVLKKELKLARKMLKGMSNMV